LSIFAPLLKSLSGNGTIKLALASIRPRRIVHNVPATETSKEIHRPPPEQNSSGPQLQPPMGSEGEAKCETIVRIEKVDLLASQPNQSENQPREPTL
jgi:hypothetical protein